MRGVPPVWSRAHAGTKPQVSSWILVGSALTITGSCCVGAALYRAATLGHRRLRAEAEGQLLGVGCNRVPPTHGILSPAHCAGACSM